MYKLKIDEIKESNNLKDFEPGEVIVIQYGVSKDIVLIVEKDLNNNSTHVFSFTKKHMSIFNTNNEDVKAELFKGTITLFCGEGFKNV